MSTVTLLISNPDLGKFLNIAVKGYGDGLGSPKYFTGTHFLGWGNIDDVLTGACLTGTKIA